MTPCVGMPSSTAGSSSGSPRRQPKISRANRTTPPPGDQDREPSAGTDDARDSDNGGSSGTPPGAGSPQGQDNRSRIRSTGGAGGTGSRLAPRPAAGTPEAQLAEALDNARQARERRLTEEPPPPDEDRKDW